MAKQMDDNNRKILDILREKVIVASQEYFIKINEINGDDKIPVDDDGVSKLIEALELNATKDDPADPANPDPNDKEQPRCIAIVKKTILHDDEIDKYGNLLYFYPGEVMRDIGNASQYLAKKQKEADNDDIKIKDYKFIHHGIAAHVQVNGVAYERVDLIYVHDTTDPVAAPKNYVHQDF